jgi:hypothetical protein
LGTGVRSRRGLVSGRCGNARRFGLFFADAPECSFIVGQCRLGSFSGIAVKSELCDQAPLMVDPASGGDGMKLGQRETVLRRGQLKSPLLISSAVPVIAASFSSQRRKRPPLGRRPLLRRSDKTNGAHKRGRGAPMGPTNSDGRCSPPAHHPALFPSSAESNFVHLRHKVSSPRVAVFLTADWRPSIACFFTKGACRRVNQRA